MHHGVDCIARGNPEPYQYICCACSLHRMNYFFWSLLYISWNVIGMTPILTVIPEQKSFNSYMHFFAYKNAERCLYEAVIVPTALCGAETWGMRSAERRKVNVLEMKCLGLVGVSRMDRVRNGEMPRRAGREKWSWQVEWIWEYWDSLVTWRKWISTVWLEGSWWRM